jgi:hypothetical protein
MCFFRSEERAREWCRARDVAPNPMVRMDQLWRLAVVWYGNRLTAESRRPTPADMPAIFPAIGLTGAFWDPLGARPS